MRALNKHFSAFKQGQICDITDTAGKLKATLEDFFTTWGNKVQQLIIIRNSMYKEL